MRRLVTWWACAAAGLWAVGFAGAQELDRSRYLFVDELKLPAKGVMKTVVQGTEIEELSIEVLSVMKRFDPRRDVILGRITDPKGERAGIVGGMSGSPIYVDGKLIGALAYGWEFQKDAYIGIQPIEQMLRARTAPPADRRIGSRAGRLPMHGGREICCRALYRLPEAAKAGDSAGDDEGDLADAAARLVPLADPLVVAGASDGTLALARRLFADTPLVPLAGGGAPPAVLADPPKLEPGATIAVVMASGDLDISMVGTCTDVVGQEVLAFGHDLFGIGATDLPMAVGYVHATVPSLMRSFKLGAPAKVVGHFVADHYTGSLGRMDGAAPTVTVEINVTDETGHTAPHRFQIAHSVRFTPRLVGMVLSAAISGQRDLPWEGIVRYRGQAVFRGLGAVRLDNVVAADEYDLIRDIVAPVDLMMDNRFGEARLDELRLDIEIIDKPLVARILDVRAPGRTFRPGETVEVGVLLRPYRQDDRVETLHLALPEDLPDGQYRCVVGDAGNEIGLRTDLEPQTFKPQDMAGLLAAMQVDPKRDRLYVRLVLDAGGLAVEGVPLADLPPSRQRMLTTAGLAEIYPYRRSIAAEKVVPFLVAGDRSFTLTVDKDAPR
jgi:hypothetical protein